jgi:NAD(P)-dependent dehydrogenase (short-subunit alcohol dehydrogenase family)
MPKVILITGASSGIGQACGEHLAARGFRVFGAQRRPAPSNAVETITMDVTDDASVERGVATVLERAGRIDVVVNNAGFAIQGSVEDTSIAEAREQLETNFFGALRVCRAVLPVMRQQGGGHIVQISSLAGVIGLPFSGLYSASKFALEGMTESLRLETRRFGIHVAMIEPGDFQSNLPATRRTAAACAANEAYRDAMARACAQQAKDEANAPPPAAIAQLVERIINDPNPRLRYSVGMLEQRIVIPLKRYLPHRVLEFILVKALGL